jgi:hypothetical protein
MSSDGWSYKEAGGWLNYWFKSFTRKGWGRIFGDSSVGFSWSILLYDNEGEVSPHGLYTDGEWDIGGEDTLEGAKRVVEEAFSLIEEY